MDGTPFFFLIVNIASRIFRNHFLNSIYTFGVLRNHFLSSIYAFALLRKYFLNSIYTSALLQKHFLSSIYTSALLRKYFLSLICFSVLLRKVICPISFINIIVLFSEITAISSKYAENFLAGCLYNKRKDSAF